MTNNSTTWTINGNSSDTVEIQKGEWVHLKLVVGDDSTAACTITQGTQELYSGTITAVEPVAEGAEPSATPSTKLKGIHLRSGRYNGVTLMDNIRVYTADQLTEE